MFQIWASQHFREMTLVEDLKKIFPKRAKKMLNDVFEKLQLAETAKAATFQPRWISIPDAIYAPTLEQKSKKAKKPAVQTGLVKKTEEPRVFEEPSPPALLNSDGLDKLVRVSHLTMIAKELTEKNNSGDFWTMTRIRDLKLDVKDEEFSMLTHLLKVQAKEAEDVVLESPLTPGSPTLPEDFWRKPVCTERNLETLPVPNIPSSVNLDASKLPPKLTQRRQRPTSNDTSPVIKPKKMKRSSLSQEPKGLQGKVNRLSPCVDCIFFRRNFWFKSVKF